MQILTIIFTLTLGNTVCLLQQHASCLHFNNYAVSYRNFTTTTLGSLLRFNMKDFVFETKTFEHTFAFLFNIKLDLFI